jgi:hypothetical protein
MPGRPHLRFLAIAAMLTLAVTGLSRGWCPMWMAAAEAAGAGEHDCCQGEAGMTAQLASCCHAEGAAATPVTVSKADTVPPPGPTVEVEASAALRILDLGAFSANPVPPHRTPPTVLRI